MNQPQTLTCNKCQAVGTAADHYTWKDKKGVAHHFGNCKKCHNLGKYQKKLTGWRKLPDDKVAGMRDQLRDRRLKIKDVAEQFSISTSTLQAWIKKGLLDE